MTLGDRIIALFFQRWLLSCAAAIYSLGLLFVSLHDGRPLTSDKIPQADNPSYLASSATSKVDPILPNLYPFHLLNYTTENLTTSNGEVHYLPYLDYFQDHRFTKALGSKLVILDVDTRPLNGSGGILNATWSDAGEGHSATMGRLSHYLYAKIHGYDYKLKTPSKPEGRYATWSKVPAIKEALTDYEFVVFMDADVTFHYPHVPLEWLFNYWDITSSVCLALAVDPADPVNDDERGKTLWNTGFMIAQRSNRTMTILDAWDSCPNNTRYPACDRFNTLWPHEQGAFGNYIRYDLNGSQEVMALPCAEANGCPESEEGEKYGCIGEFVQHRWKSKHLVPSAVKDTILQYFLPHVHSLFLQQYDGDDEK